MPELAEVEYFRRQWQPGQGAVVQQILAHGNKRIFRGVEVERMKAAISGAKLTGSETRGKQMLFRFSGGGWLGIHLGMTGELRLEPPDYKPGKHEHLVLGQSRRSLVFRDPRLFGRVRFAISREAPEWWATLPPAVTSDAFTLARMRAILHRRGRAPLKALLLMQPFFPGIGNWMADEALWQARLHPRRAAGRLDEKEARTLRTVLRRICRTSLRTIGVDWSDPPEGWLLHVRWKKGGHCPVCGLELERAQVGGRTTVWCGRCQAVK